MPDDAEHASDRATDLGAGGRQRTNRCRRLASAPGASVVRTARRVSPRAVLGIVAALALAALGGTACSRGDPWVEPVKASSAAAYTAWHSRMSESVPADARKQVEQALQDIRFKIMGERAATGSAGIEGELRRRIDGQPLRHVVQLGVELRLERLRGEFNGLKQAMNANLRLVTRPGDVDSRHHLEGVEARQKQRLDDLGAQIAQAERELAPLVAATGRTLVAVDAAATDVRPEMKKQ